MVWNRLIPVCVVLLAFARDASAQVAENRYLVYFADKVGVPYSIAVPEAFLSQRTIERRRRQGIAVDVLDLPVNEAYVQKVRNLGDVQVLGTSKWMNFALIETTDPNVLDAIEALPEVVRMEVSTYLPHGDWEEVQPVPMPKQGERLSPYGEAHEQITQIRGTPLHAMGYRGEGMYIAVLDGGFSFANTAAVLQPLYDSGRIVATRNFVQGHADVYGLHPHGTYVLSTMAADVPGLMIGTAPRANYILCITEDVAIERRIEEALWIMAAEYADSLGADIINTSLGYTDFDDLTENYTYADMDGNTALITRGSNMAASRGMLLVTSAGNQGHTPWRYISAPADGHQVLAVGAVWQSGDATWFSSRGPSYDGRVKPNVMARGGATIITNLADSIQGGNGTSFSAPIIAGMSACLWQAVPGATAREVQQAIEQSAHLYSTPNDSMGFGIPNFEQALVILESIKRSQSSLAQQGAVTPYPNPYTGGPFAVRLSDWMKGPATITLSDATGRAIHRYRDTIYGPYTQLPLEQALGRLLPGVYHLSIALDEDGVYTAPFVKL